VRLPWQDKTGLAKAAAILSAVLMVAAGLCGVNYVAMGRSSGTPSNFLIIAALWEAAIMGGCILGLIVIRLILIVRRLRGQS
jgi:hypothetical protein